MTWKDALTTPWQEALDAAGLSIDDWLAAGMLRGRKAWPAIVLSELVFGPFVIDRVCMVAPVNVSTQLEAMQLEDLYLACACLQGNAEALTVLTRTLLPQLESHLARVSQGGTADVLQDLARRLLVADGDRPPRLAAYGGRGQLRKWLRVAATRLALDSRRGRDNSQEQLDDAAVATLAAPGEDQELAYLRQLYRREFKEAFAQALATLSSRERNLLRLQLLDGLSLEEIGSVYKVHRATIARWNAQARETLLVTTRKVLLGKLRVEHRELESIMRLIQSQFDVSICRQLEESSVRADGAVCRGPASSTGGHKERGSG